ncbi:MAG: T9SS type A sorting domain-containing protein [Candidatus Kapaibacteriota bacterium]
MKIFLSLIVLFFAIPLIAEKDPKFRFDGKELPNFFDIQKAFYKEYSEKTDFMQSSKDESNEEGMFYHFKRWEWFWKQRVLPDGEFPQPMILQDIYQKELRRSQKSKTEQALSLKPNWKNLGPTNIPLGGGAGRVNGIHIPAGQQNIIWAAAAGGGAWKSTNGGKTWQTTTDKLGTLGVTDITTDPKNPNIVYLATGDAFGADTYYGAAPFSIGLIKSVDGGLTWTQTGLNYQQKDTRALSRVLVHPTNTSIILVGGNNGIHRSTDGGVTFNTRFVGDVKDMEMKPDDPSVYYATSGSKIYISRDAGDKWTELKSNIPTTIGRIAIAVTPAEPEAIFAITAKRGSWDFGGFYRSYDGGENWDIGATTPNIIGRNLQGTDTENQQGWYDLCIAVSPDNPDLIFIGGINIWRSTNGGSNWSINTYWVPNQGRPYVHADVHDLDFINSTTIITGTDGGVSLTTNRGLAWTDLSDGLEITQFYRMSISQQRPDIVIGGAQDNGTSYRSGPNEWKQVWGGDGMDNAIDPVNDKYMFVSSQNGNFGRSTNGGSSFSSSINSAITSEEGEWVTPIEFAPNAKPGAASLVYAGYRDVWKTDSLGFWNKTSNFPNKQSRIMLLAHAPSRPGTLIASNFNASYITYDEGQTWRQIQFPNGIASSIITSFEFHPSNDSIFWISISGFGSRKVFQTNNAGTNSTWTDLSGGMPPIPVNCLRYQPNSPDRLYAGTDLGVYYRDNSTKVWIPYNEGLPNTVISDIEIHKSTKKLRVSSYGRGTWEADMVNCPELTCSVQVQGNLTFCSGDSVTFTAQDGFATYMWSNGATTKSITVKDAGNYSLTVYDANGCPSGFGPIAVTVYQRRIPNIISNRTIFTICDNTPLTLDAGSNFDKYIWSTGDTTRTITVNTPGIITVATKNKLGCIDSDTVTILQGSNPIKPTITKSNDTLFASSAYAYQWMLADKDIPNAKGRFYVLPRFADNRNYSVRVFSEQGCSTNSDAMTITSITDLDGQYQYSLFPNPANQSVYVSVPKNNTEDILQFSIIDVKGSKVKSGILQLNGINSFEIQLTDIPKGRYWVQILVQKQLPVTLPLLIQ